MFRGKTKSKMQPDQFGVGSLLKGDVGYLVVTLHNGVILLNLRTMEISENFVSVEDVNFISEDEARKISDLTGLKWTFSDFDIDTKGLKCS